MRCGKVQRLISARADGELDDGRREGVERHLAACETCRAFADGLAPLANMLDQVEAPEPRWGFPDRVLARLPAEEPAASPIQGLIDLLRPAPLGVGTAAFCLGVATTFSLNGANGETTVNGTTQDAVIEAVAGDYATVYAEALVQQQLWVLLSETED